MWGIILISVYANLNCYINNDSVVVLSNLFICTILFNNLLEILNETLFNQRKYLVLILRSMFKEKRRVNYLIWKYLLNMKVE